MPKALDFSIGGSAEPFERELQRAEQMAVKYSRNITRGIEQRFKVGGPNPDSTLFKTSRGQDAQRDYVEFWQKAFKEREDAEVNSAVAGATRSNRARALLRQRAEAREAALPMQGPDLSGHLRKAYGTGVAHQGEWQGPMRQKYDAATPGGFAVGGISSGSGGVRGRFGFAASRFGVAGSMFTSVARDSAASLASGAPITQVIAQQAPQVLQALSMMRLGTVAIGVAAAAVAAVITYKMVKSLTDSFFLTNNIRDGLARVAAMSHRLVLKQHERLAGLRQESEIILRLAKIEEERVKAANELADAQADIEKEKIKGRFIANTTVRNKEQELALEKALLNVDLARARAKFSQIKTDIESGKINATNLAEAEAALAKFNEESSQTAADDEAAVKEAFSKRFGKAGGFLSHDSNLSEEEKASAMAAIASAQYRQALNQSRAAAELKMLKQQLAAAKAKDPSTQLAMAEAVVRKIENQIGMMELLPEVEKEKITKQNASSGSPNVTDRQRINIMSGGEAPLVDIGRQQLRALQTLVAQGKNSGNINIPFGGPK